MSTGEQSGEPRTGSGSAASPARLTCPSCSRQVEPGFRFCDACGTKLEAGPLRTEKPAEADKAKPKPLLERWRERRKAKAEEPKEAVKAKEPPERASAKAEPDAPPPRIPPVPVPPAPPADVPSVPARPADVPPVPVPPARPPPPRITSRPISAEESRSSETIGAAGRLRSQETEGSAEPKTEERPPVAERPPTTWRAAPARGAIPARSPAATVGIFILHVLVAFAAGAVLLGIAAAVASLTSNGRVALLEIRALPILIAGSTAIIVFSLLRTGPRARGSRWSIGLSVLIGFVVLIAAVAYAYQPSLMADAQRELDRTLGIFGADVADAIQRFEADVDQWNSEVNNYREHLRKVDSARDDETDPERLATAEETFRVDASGSEEALDGIYERMRSHADGVEHAPLRGALQDLAEIFNDELSGIRLITRGFVENDQAFIQSGNTRFTNATERAVELFDDRVRPLLERGDIDPEPLAASVAELGAPSR